MRYKIDLFIKLISISIRSQMQHRASFIMLSFGHFMATVISIIAIWILFDRFQTIQGWTFSEVCLLYGTVHIGFSIAECVARGFDTFDEMVKHGEFDRVLLRPLGTLFQIASRQVQLMRVGRFLQGCLVLSFGLSQIQITFFILVVIAMSIMGCASVFYGLFVLQATLAFWTTETLELVNITTYGGVEACQYPMSIYPSGFRLIFTLLIPLASVTYYPIATLFGHESISYWLICIMPISGVIFLYLCCKVWHLGVRHYSSTGS